MKTKLKRLLKNIVLPLSQRQTPAGELVTTPAAETAAVRWKSLLMAALSAVGFAAFAAEPDAVQLWKPVLFAKDVRVEQRFPWTNLVDVCFTVTNTLVKNDKVIARVRGFYDGQMMLDMDHLYLAKADGSPDLSKQFVGGDVSLEVDGSGKFQQVDLKPNEVRLVWDAKKDVPPEAEWTKTLHVTVELEPPTQDVTVQCHNGQMIGEAHGIGDGSNVTAKIVSFLGVPFAHPPTNDFNEVGDVTHIRRWKAPEWAPTNKTLKIQAKRFTPSPLQKVATDETSSSTRRSEDCLYLNLWTGYTNDEKPINENANKPVLVFIHGGSFIHGGTKELINDCRYLAEKYGNDVVFATLEYRLGLLAEFDFTDIAKDKEQWKRDYPDHGRIFIKDLQMGLRWLKANVKNFGGDPNRITVSGESAGSISTFYLMAKYNQDTDGNQLFQRAIPMSGAEISCSRADYTNAHHGAALCEALRQSTAAAGGDPSKFKANSMDTLQKATEQELVAALMWPLEKVRKAGVDAKSLILSDNSIIFDLFMRPLAEGREGDPDSTKYAIAGTNVYDAIASTTKAIDLLTGTVGNEARYWAFSMYMYPPSPAEHPLDFFYNGYLPMTFARCMDALPAKEGEALASFIDGCADGNSPFHEADDDNPSLNFGYGDLWGKTEILGELQFRQPQVRLAENYSTNAAARAANKKCYMYIFEKGQVLPGKPWARAMHASELPYLFNHPYYTDYGPLNRGLMDRFSEMIVEFVKTGVPKYRANDGDQDPKVPTEYRVKTDDKVRAPRSTVIIRDLEPDADSGTGNCMIEEVADPLRERRRLLMPVSEALPPGMF